MSYEESCAAIQLELNKEEKFRDVSRLRKLFRDTHKHRRTIITSNGEGVVKMLESFPLLARNNFVSIVMARRYQHHVFMGIYYIFYLNVL